MCHLQCVHIQLAIAGIIERVDEIPNQVGIFDVAEVNIGCYPGGVINSC
ncbi:MAG: hypothetical protein IJ667_13075 [Synergistaceae bacterium]|nr:hypothetical protein [Synergistaceae bacterium]